MQVTDFVQDKLAGSCDDGDEDLSSISRSSMMRQTGNSREAVCLGLVYY
jgi:hypothetical protein